MKIDRLLSIITILLQRKRITAPELAKRLEVSRRTILRDIDDICKAGIPIVTFQGADGGISIAEGYKLDKSILSVDELQNIVTGLKSLNSVSQNNKIDMLISKLSPENNTESNLMIDLASHYKTSLSEKINIIRNAIKDNKLIHFDYYSEKGIARRIVEPYFLTYRWAAWYIFGFCKEKDDFRMFKLNRLWRLELLDEDFQVRIMSTEEYKKTEALFKDDRKIIVIFDKTVEYLLVEEFGPDCYEETDEGKLKFTWGFTNTDYIKRWLLGFGCKAKVIEPSYLAEEIKEIAKKIVTSYERDI